jgi:hypothetical protein
MANNEGTRKCGDYQVVSTVPDVCKKLCGTSIVPVAY